MCILLFFIDEFDIVVDQIDGRQRVGGEVLIEMDFIVLAFDADNHAVEQARAVDDDVLFFNFLVFNQGIEKTYHARSIGGKVLTLAVRKILRAADEDEQQQRNNAQVAYLVSMRWRRYCDTVSRRMTRAAKIRIYFK